MKDPVSSVVATDGELYQRRVLRPRFLLLGLLLTAVVLRGGLLWVWSENLSDDRDAYLALAEGLAAGRGFSVQQSDVPTAFRPPLYPLLLTYTGAGRAPVARGLLHLLLGTGTVWLTYLLGRRLGLGAYLSLFAAALVAFDPLLLRYTTFPMTETLATFLAAALLVSISPDCSRRRQILTGFLFGLSVLCRPTMWAFGGLMLLRWSAHFIRSARGQPSESTEVRTRVPWLTISAVILTVAPWVVRNLLVMGHPIVMTAHGGYTLLLGNNPAFYREVLDQPWGTVWDGSVGGGQATWLNAIDAELHEAGITGEVDRDRWMRRRALRNILAQPGQFLRACWLRLRRFWSLTPSGSDAHDLPPGVRAALGCWFGGIFVLAAIGLVRVLRSGSAAWSPALLMLTAFVAVHFVYWSNARMRAPVVPVISLLAARGISRPTRAGMVERVGHL